MNKHYDNLSSPPADALRKIDYGALKGKSDINPQWRYEALTNEFGLCGQGWKFEIANTFTEPVPSTQELMIFVQINLYIKEEDKWSEPIPGFGGDFLIVKDKNGIHGNDEGYKMAITDALGTAAKMVGVAADVYRGVMDSKYSNRKQEPNTRAKSKTADEKTEAGKRLREKMAELEIGVGTVKEISNLVFQKDLSELSTAEAADLAEHLPEYYQMKQDADEKLMEGVA